MIELDHLLLTENLLTRLSRVEEEIHRRATEFANLVIQTTAESGSYSHCGLSARIIDGCNAFEVVHSNRTLRFSYAPVFDAALEMVACITVHLVPSHPGYEVPRVLGSFVIDAGGRTPNFRAQGQPGPLSALFAHGAMAIVHHYVYQAISGGFSLPGNPGQH